MSYENNNVKEGTICLFYSHINSVEQIARFSSYLLPWNVATTKDKVDYFIWHCQFYNFRFSQLNLVTNHLKFSIWILDKSLEVALQKPIDWFNFIAFFAGPDPPEWRSGASVAYFKDKLYYLGGRIPKSMEYTNRVDVRRSNESSWNNLFRF